MSTETPDEARIVEPVVFMKSFNDDDDPYDFRPRPEVYDQMEEDAAPKDFSAPEPAPSSPSEQTEIPESQETPAGAEKVNLSTATEEQLSGLEPTSKPSKTSTGSAKPPASE